MFRFLTFGGRGGSARKLDLVGIFRGQRYKINFYNIRENKLRKVEAFSIDLKCIGLYQSSYYTRRMQYAEENAGRPVFNFGCKIHQSTHLNVAYYFVVKNMYDFKFQ